MLHDCTFLGFYSRDLSKTHCSPMVEPVWRMHLECSISASLGGRLQLYIYQNTLPKIHMTKAIHLSVSPLMCLREIIGRIIY